MNNCSILIFLGQLMKVLNSIKREIIHRVNRKDMKANESLSSKLESLVQQQISEFLDEINLPFLS